MQRITFFNVLIGAETATSVFAQAEDGGTYAHHGGAFIDGYAVVVAHAHAHCVEIWAGVEV